MSEASQPDGAPDSALTELWRSLTLVSRRLGLRVQPSVWDRIASATSKWSCAFYSCGTFAGCVDPKRMPYAKLGRVIPVQDFFFGRRMLLAKAGLLPESKIYDAGNGMEEREWDAKARELGIILPRLIRDYESNSEEYARLEREASHYEWPGAYRDPLDQELGRVDDTQDVRLVATEAAEVVSQEDAEFARHSLDIAFLSTAIEIELESIAWIQERVVAIEDAVRSLPTHIAEALNRQQNYRNRGGDPLPPWESRVLIDVVDKLCRWPARDGSGRQPIPQTAQELFERFIACDPRTTWKAAGESAGALAHEITFVSSLDKVEQPAGAHGAHIKGPAPLPNDAELAPPTWNESVRWTYEILVRLHSIDPAKMWSQADILKEMGDGEISGRTLTTALGTLEEQGYIARPVDKKGARVVTPLPQWAKTYCS